MGICSRNCSVLLFSPWMLKGCLSVVAELHRGSQDSSALVQDLGDGMSFIVLVTKRLLGKVFFPPGHSLMHRSTQSYSHIPEHSPRHPGCRSLCGCSDSWAQLKPVLGLSCPCLSGKMSLWLCGEQGDVTACLSLQPVPMGTMG